MEPDERQAEVRSRRGLGYLLEAVMVLVGVLAAFLVEGYREDAEKAEQASLAMERIANEVAENLIELLRMQAITGERLALIGELEAELEPGRPFSDFIGRFRGFRLLQADDSAWTSMKLGNYTEAVPQAFMQEAFQIYGWNDLLGSLNDKVSDLVFGPLMYRSEDAVAAWSITRTITWQQNEWTRSAVPLYCDFLARWAPDAARGYRVEDVQVGEATVQTPVDACGWDDDSQAAAPNGQGTRPDG